MPSFADKSERLAAVNAVIQGDLRHLGNFLDQLNDIDDRVAKVEGGSGASAPKVSFDDIQPVSVPGSEARASEVRDAVIELASAFNAFVAKFKD